FQGTDYFAEALSYFPDMTHYNLGPGGYLEHIRKAKAAVDIPVIASMNGVSSGGWIAYASEIEEAGADALELNIYYLPTELNQTASEIEEMYISLARNIRAAVTIPIAVKLSPFFSAFPNFARQLDQTGINGLVLFNRFYQPDIDLEELSVAPTLVLSNPGELRMRLRWVAVLYGHVSADLAVTGGIHSARDVLKSMMAGAKVAMTTSALLIHGFEHLRRINVDLLNWMEENEYQSISQMQGSMSHLSVADPSAFERANYMKVLRSFEPYP
ncbi:MAG: dihydroorotate dehydrogenase-like protein, partial [Anaerolineales bacterium]|nr:dihydroorotate dehydrogenase-like protein [Anaerolineales bacterium]